MVIQQPKQVVENISYDIEEIVYEDSKQPAPLPVKQAAPAPAPAPKPQPQPVQQERVGLGLTLEFDQEYDEIFVYEVIPGFAGERAGIMRDDVILAIEGKSVRGMSLKQCRDITVDREGTTCTLLVRRGNQELTYTCTRIMPTNRNLDPRQDSAVKTYRNTPPRDRNSASYRDGNPGQM